MRLVRLFLILLLILALPFTNVAAASMAHCENSSGMSQEHAAEPADHGGHGGQHADHGAISDHDQSDHSQHGAVDQNDAACSHCSYCQSCVSAIAPRPASALPLDIPAKEKFRVTDQVMQSFQEPFFRPPRLAFV